MHKKKLSIIAYKKEEIQEFFYKTKYTVYLSNGLVFLADFSNNQKFHIRVAIDDPSEKDKHKLPKLSQVELSCYINGTEFYLQQIQNENELTKKTGVASMMMMTLLTLIADYNSTCNKEITKITGTMVMVGSSSYKELQKFYRSLNHLSDYKKRIKIIIDISEWKKYKISYHIKKK